MLFNSIDFIIFFVLFFVAFLAIRDRHYKHLLILGASYFFFYYTSNYLISLLIFSTILDFYVGKKIWECASKQKKKILLGCSIAGNLGLLGFFKYSDFAITQFNQIGQSFGISEMPYLSLALPIGISFYTFQTLSYTIDIYRGHLTPSKSIKEFAVYVAFFPQLVAGPIIRASQFLPQLREKITNYQTEGMSQKFIRHSNFKTGLTMIAFGFMFKMFFADNIAPLANQLENSMGFNSSMIILSTIAYGMQIYGDFSGYSSIAIGIALLLGFKIPINFNKPYFATSPSDFWKRWHISLSTWLKDYLYIPLGGNKKSSSRTYLNLFAVMFFGGLWHGASWNFVIWGILHGSYLAIHKVITNKFPHIKDNMFLKNKWGTVLSILVTQYFIFLAWIPFRIQDGSTMLHAIEKYILFDFQFDYLPIFISKYSFEIILIVLFMSINFISYKIDLIDKISNLKMRYWTLFFAGVVLSILFFYGGNSEEFIYFQF